MMELPWDAVLDALQTTYALLDARDRIVAHTPRFALWLTGKEQQLRGQWLVDVLPEFFGQEEELARVRRGESPCVRVEQVNRSTPTGETRYYTFTALNARRERGWLILLVTDITEQGKYLQDLMQSRNELRLLRRQLTEANEQLDFLLRNYVSPEVADALVQGVLRPEVGGELREISVLFADIRNFTPFAESLPPDEVVATLNEYLAVAVGALHESGGTVNQFQGDNVMALFNAPFRQADHAVLAVKAGVALQRAMAAYRAALPTGRPRLHFGVGINTGPAIVGNSGARWRYTYTALGDTVNTGFRIMAATPADQVWISGTTYKQLGGAFRVEPLPPRRLKGKSRPLPLYRVVG